MNEEVKKQETSGVICTLEDREVLEKMKQAKINKLKEIEINKKKSDAIDTGCEIAKGIVKVAGAVLTVVMAVCPLDGPFGEVATVLGSAALVKAIDSGKDVLKATLVKKDVGEISAALVDLSGNVKQIIVEDKDLVENVKPNNIQNQNMEHMQERSENNMRI